MSALTGISGKFVNNEVISIHSFKPIISSSKDGPSEHANTSPINIFHVSLLFVLDDSIIRSLVSESSIIFHNLQTTKIKTNDIYLRTSRAYRSAVRMTLTKLKDAVGEDEEPENVRKFEHYSTIFYSIECLWHLCEFLLIDHSTLSIVPNLLEWVNLKIIERYLINISLFVFFCRRSFIFLRPVKTLPRCLSIWIVMWM